jgi:hypothetical protein
MSSSALMRSIGSLLGDHSADREAFKRPKPQRRRLWEVPSRLHCPIIGTCLSVSDLQRAIRKAGVQWTQAPQDIDIHHVAVHRASEPCRLSKTLHKLLEKRYQRYIQNLSSNDSSAQLLAHWRQAMDKGEIPGAFWAIVTHPAADEALFETLRGDVHMLSHLNGASHRADLAKLSALEQEAQRHRQALEKSRLRNRDLAARKDARIAQLEELVLKLKSEVVDDANGQFLAQQLDASRHTQARAERRAERAEQRLAERERQLDEYTQDLSALRELLDETRGELALAEKHLTLLLQGVETEDAATDNPRLQGRRVVYIGGRRSLTPYMRNLVQRMEGKFIHHDGGIEDSRMALDEVLQNADLVFCPIDCISHDACHRAKTCCRRSGAHFVPLRSSGLSSFTLGLEQAAHTVSERAYE